ncbi:DUF4132 domain-containing protein [Rubrobacter marinus]|uniref:DUF4132 domain-containing protein n=2 Tax=Rubrobacter marinus TaxID=2653852 RepID=A0A6G8Q2W0_9ACTN|nr:DUF4132 domain-containing protein [Rubrobacter marinus]
MTAVLRRRLPFDHADLMALLAWSLRQPLHYFYVAPQLIKAVEGYTKEHELTPELRERIGELAQHLVSGYTTADTRRWAKKLRELAGLRSGTVPLVAGEAWSDVAIHDVETEDDEGRRTAWVELLGLCAGASGAKPSARWRKDVERHLEGIGFGPFKEAVLRWFPLVERPRTRPIEEWSEWAPDPNLLIEDSNADVLKGLAWACGLQEDAELSRALTALALSAYKKVPQVGARCVRVGNACVWALGNMPGMGPIGQLALLKVRVKAGTAQKGVEKALAAAAARLGLPEDEIEEMSVPSYGMTEVGLRREALGGFTAELAVTGTSSVEIRWTRPDGKAQKSVPKAVKEEHAQGLGELKGASKDVQKMLTVQRDRIENLYLEAKVWPYGVWRERYLDHPLVGTLARRLIWRFTDGDRTVAGVWYGGRMVDRTGRVLSWLGDSTRVELWHPIGETPDEVMAWRDWLAELEIRQPFKQAHREVYLLTDAERNTRVYSNRFAAHVLKQHQFNALCSARGWKNSLRLMVDDEYPPATRHLPAHGLRAELWVEGLGEDYGTDTTEAGTYLYVATDQVRFYGSDARENYAHAGGGGYGPVVYGAAAAAEPLALEEVPPLVFSEAMRDADLFVGVASVGNDPNWSDGGPEGRYRDYWTSYSFGELSATARTRAQVLEKLVPRLKIGDRCRLEERFLVVRGDVRTYRIHLGSGNILMEPNDQYLCIVPASGSAFGGNGNVFLPFEGDRTLAVVLSKAFLLASDRDIKDPTILSQIHGTR